MSLRFHEAGKANIRQAVYTIARPSFLIPFTILYKMRICLSDTASSASFCP
jgi:hypothetical protein